MEKHEQFLIVEADWNDGDYITQVTPINDEVLERFAPLFKQIKAEKGKWEVYDYSDTDAITELYGELATEFHENYVPTSYDNSSVHTIVSIQVMKLVKDVL